MRKVLAVILGLFFGVSTFFSYTSVLALDSPQVITISTGTTTLEDLDVDYYVTSSGSSGTFTLSGTFDLPDGESVTADPVYSGTCIPASGTSTSDNMQSCSLTPRVNGVNTTYGHHVSEISWSDTAALTLTGSLPSSSDVVITKVSYKLVQHIFIGFDRPVVGTCTLDFGQNISVHAIVYPDSYSNAGYYFISYPSSGRFTFRSFGSSTIRVDLVHYYNSESSLPSTSYSPLLSFDSSTFDGSGLSTYELPVSDSATHSALNDLVSSVSGNESLVSSQTSALSSKTSSLSTSDSQLHNLESSLLTDMDSNLNNVKTNSVGYLLNNWQFSTTAQWLGSQMTNLVQGSGTSLFEWTFIFPLVIGIALLLIGRLR